MQKITPFLWFNDNAEEAMNFYTSIFKNAKIEKVTRYQGEGAKAAGRPEGSVMTASFQLEGQQFIVLNGGPQFQFTEAISFVVNCESQEEIDALWNKLSEGGEESRCGWLKDKYGLSWQIVPADMGNLLGGTDPERSQRVMHALLQMGKIDKHRLQQAYAEQPV